ncbi:MAG: cupin domain-containing protein [Anaerolineae bacterium]|nr:cupin domain-containing protein [Anaerolineae bacterium]
MPAFAISELMAQQAQTDERYLEFLRVPALSMGLYVLPVGSVDEQRPHQEDEVYYVIRGRAQINIAGQDYLAEPGRIIFVAAQVPHHFHAISEELAVLVFFAPAES